VFTEERYLEAGDKVPVSSHGVIMVRQPDQMTLEWIGELRDQRVDYNGKSVTVTEHQTAKSLSLEAPPRLEDMLPKFKAQHDLHMPFGDLLQRDAFDVLSLGLKSAEYVGLRKVNGVDCHQLAFAQDDLDWALWVQAGSQPLPMKITIDYKTATQNPRYRWECRKWEVAAP
jgi:hypothetical protein